jgi:hypothetical protein
MFNKLSSSMNAINLVMIFTKLFFIFSVLLVFFEFITHQNFVIYLFRIDYVDTFALATLFFVTAYIVKYNFKIFSKWKSVIFMLPIVLITSIVIIYIRRFDLFMKIEVEDGLVELGQVILLFSSALISAVISKYYWGKNKILGVLFAILAFAMFFIAGEEISWGQRIFNIQTPDSLAAANTQGEINLHNNRSVWHFVYKAYALVGFIGSFAWLTKGLLNKYLPKSLASVSKVIPDWQYILYFFPTFLYNFEVHILNPIRKTTGDAHWEEPIELLMFIGITLFLIEKFLRKKQTI